MTFDYRAVIKKTEEVKKAQEDRALSSGIPGISTMWMAKDTQRTVRFLHPYDLAIDLWIHNVPVPGSKRPMSYVCQSQFSGDTMAYCPICADMENESLSEDLRKSLKPKRVKNFLVYDYGQANSTYLDQKGGVVKANPVCIYALGPGDMNEKNWLALQSIQTSFGGLSLVDVVVSRTGTGLDTVITFVGKPVPMQQPDGTITLSIIPFDKNLIAPEVLEKIPPIPSSNFQFDASEEAYDLCTKWGEFFIKAGRYKMPDTYRTPNLTFNQPPQMPIGGSQHAYQNQIPPQYLQTPVNPYQTPTQYPSPTLPQIVHTQQPMYQQPAQPVQQLQQPMYQQPVQQSYVPQMVQQSANPVYSTDTGYVMPTNEPTPKAAWD